MSSLVTSSTVSAASPTGTPEPISIVLRSSVDGTSDFFPFHDIASLNTGGSSGNQDEFSFRSLIEEGVEGGQEIVLFASGCQIDGVSDCPRACNDTEHFFGSLETFYNCAALSSIVYWTREDMVYFISEEAERNASIIMGDGSLANFQDGPVLDSFIGCAQDSCDNDGLGVPCSRSIDGLNKDVSTPRQVLDAWSLFCPDVTAEIDPDIFGPGVLISYLLQVGFAISLSLLLKVFSLWVKFSQKRDPRHPKRANTFNRMQTIIWRDSSAQSRTSIALATTLVEFQEAQCWFVFAVQIASILAIVVNSQEGAFWGEIIVNAAIAYHISQNGILPMFLVQVCLHNEGIRNWHTFVGFFAEYLLAIVATTQKIHFRDAFNLFKKQNGIGSCGGNPSPRTYCASLQGVNGISFFPSPVLYKMVFLVLDTIAIAVLLADQVAWTLRKHHRTRDVKIGSWQAGRFPDVWYKKHWNPVKTWFWRILEAAYLIINVLYMVSLVQVISAESFAANRWSYGQIIAVTVWGPVIVKMFDLILSGPQQNDIRMDSGPPRLRIDNVLNRRTEDAINETGGESKRIPGPPPAIDEEDHAGTLRLRYGRGDRLDVDEGKRISSRGDDTQGDEESGSK